jgi:hypothetical protein
MTQPYRFALRCHKLADAALGADADFGGVGSKLAVFGRLYYRSG